MQYHLDTIPVWDAMAWPCACPLCGLARRTEREEVERTLGASVMEPDERIRINARGFCRAHQGMLYAQQNRLGHALLMDSHGKTQRETLNRLRAETEKAPRFGRSFKSEAFCDALGRMDDACAVCDRIENHMARYRYTFLHLWKNDAAFHSAWLASKGLCLPHTRALFSSALQTLGAAQQHKLAAEAMQLLTASLDADAADLDWFTRKFDYRNQNEPWGESKTALERMVNRLRGWCLGEEPAPRKE